MDSHYSSFDVLYAQLLPEEKNARLMNLAKNNGSSELIEILIQCGADINITCPNGMTPFLFAVKAGNHKTISVFLKHNIFTLCDTDRLGYNALMLTLWHDQLKNTFYFLMKNYGQYMSVDMINAAMISAAIKEKPEEAQVLMNTKKINVNYRDYKGNTALMYAVMYDNVKMIELLLTNNADINIKNFENETVFDWAKKSEDPAVLDALSKSWRIGLLIRTPTPKIYPDLSEFLPAVPLCQEFLIGENQDEEMFDEDSIMQNFSTLSLNAAFPIFQPSAPSADLFDGDQRGIKRKAVKQLDDPKREIKKRNINECLITKSFAVLSLEDPQDFFFPPTCVFSLEERGVKRKAPRHLNERGRDIKKYKIP